MSLQVTQMLCPTEKYNIKCPYLMVPEAVTVHNTANDASAISEVSYMLRNNNQVSYHYAVDDYRAVQGIPLNRNTWHASDGNGFGNRKTISIEICYSKSGGTRFEKAEQNTAYLIACILQERGWGIERVKKHQDFTNKRCPHRTLDLGWQRFLNMIQSYMFEPIRHGRDYSVAFNAEYYNNKYSDMQNAFHGNAEALFEHFLVYGIYEGRQAAEGFNVNIYMNNYYSELYSAFGEDKGAYLEHYIDYGRNEGRKAV